jgi:hypothetical protein
MKRTYTIHVREEGRGNPAIRTFKTLADLQTYVRDHWFGVEYIDGPTSFHSDYCTFDLFGAKLRDLGDHAGPWGTDSYWSWDWKDLAGVVETSDAPTVAAEPADSCPVCGTPTFRGRADCGCLWK